MTDDTFLTDFLTPGTFVKRNAQGQLVAVEPNDSQCVGIMGQNEELITMATIEDMREDAGMTRLYGVESPGPARDELEFEPDPHINPITPARQINPLTGMYTNLSDYQRIINGMRHAGDRWSIHPPPEDLEAAGDVAQAAENMAEHMRSRANLSQAVFDYEYHVDPGFNRNPEPRPR